MNEWENELYYYMSKIITCQQINMSKILTYTILNLPGFLKYIYKKEKELSS